MFAEKTTLVNAETGTAARTSGRLLHAEMGTDHGRRSRTHATAETGTPQKWVRQGVAARIDQGRAESGTLCTRITQKRVRPKPSRTSGIPRDVPVSAGITG